MKYFVGMGVLLIGLLTACTFHPIVDPRSPEVAAATQTAKAESIPPLLTTTPEVVPPTATVELVPTVTPTPACVVKGNIDARGRKLYHLPGSPNYNQVVIDPSKGEKCFDTEQDAVDAGWIKAGN